jgi:aspartyl-tRNA(Asn)/glutamyl-tRNA(Gln) amidotransferase subunit C
MAVEKSDIEKAATLARIRIDEKEIPEMVERLTEILAMVDTMQAVNTDNVEPMANPHDATQRLRPDIVTEENQREAFQQIAPNAEQGLYLVPKVIE